ncbi:MULTISPECIES: hypothetical protein [unclassified Streptomyces]|uniref:Thymidine kinase n=1 Tax=Streptomyces sp. NBC_00180 TaxID=2903632 RepID=A0AAU1HW70_9ACTN|nr:hypothetical protein OG331_22780 [Streptomyces sp. NBC_01017]
MTLLLNTAFDAGKTSLAEELSTRRRTWILFDPEAADRIHAITKGEAWRIYGDCAKPRGRQEVGSA